MEGSRFSRDNFLQLEPHLLRAVLRERTHHTLESRVYSGLAGETLNKDSANTVRCILEVWEERGLDETFPDVLWARQLLEVFDSLVSGKRPEVVGQTPRKFSKSEIVLVDELVFERRSVRRWTDEPVSVNIVEQIIRAALWAPHACNLQTIRFIVINSSDDPVLLRSAEFEGYTVKIVVLQDMRAYEFFKSGIPAQNQLLDCGAAVQNMLLYAHALGLGAVWSTFLPREIAHISTYFGLPDYIKPVTYVALGWPSQSPLPPARINISDAVLRWPTV